MHDLKWDKEFALEQAANDDSLLAELVGIFKESCSDDFLALREGIAQDDAEKSCAAAHSLKGAAASLGVEGIREIAQEIEEDSRQGSLVVAREKIADLQQLLALLDKI